MVQHFLNHKAICLSRDYRTDSELLSKARAYTQNLPVQKLIQSEV